MGVGLLYMVGIVQRPDGVEASTPVVEHTSRPRLRLSRRGGAKEMEVAETVSVSHKDLLPVVPSAGQEREKEKGEITDSSEEPYCATWHCSQRASRGR